MKLLLINPNISDSVSELIHNEALRNVAPGTELTMLTAPFGVAYIETRLEALIGAYAAAQLAAEHGPQHDAVIIAAFGDPGLAGIRELLPVPVVDGVSSAVRHAQSLVALEPGHAQRGSFAPPPRKPNKGLPDALARALN